MTSQEIMERRAALVLSALNATGEATVTQVWRQVNSHDILVRNEVRRTLHWLLHRKEPLVANTRQGSKGNPGTWRLTPAGQRMLRRTG